MLYFFQFWRFKFTEIDKISQKRKNIVRYIPDIFIESNESKFGKFSIANIQYIDSSSVTPHNHQDIISDSYCQ